MKSRLVSQHVSIPECSQKLGLVCTAVGYVNTPSLTSIVDLNRREKAPFSGKLIKIDEWLLSYVINGALLLKLENGIQHKIKAGMISVIPQGTCYEYSYEQDTNICIYYIIFKGKSLEERKVCTSIDELCPVTEIGLNIEIVEIFQRLFETSQSTSEGTQRELGATIVLLVAKLVNCRHEYQSIHTRPSMVDRAIILMHNHINDHISIDEIAKEVNVPISTFRRTFCKAVGVSPYQYLLQCKIEYAKRELIRSDTPHRVIAEMLGFSDQYHFSRVFKHITGMRPTRWRTENKDSL